MGNPEPAKEVAADAGTATKDAASAEGAAKPDAAKPEAKPEVKQDATAETKPEGTSEAKSESAAEAKAETPTYELKFPEGANIDKEGVDAFTKLFGEIESGKLDHAGFSEKAQNLVDMHVKSLTDTIERLNTYYEQIHEKQKSDWHDSFRNDAEIGGERAPQTVRTVREAIDSYGGSPEQITELREQMKSSGYGNYPPLIRLINNMQAKINSYTKESAGGIVPGQAPAPTKVKDYQRFYGSN